MKIKFTKSLDSNETKEEISVDVAYWELKKQYGEREATYFIGQMVIGQTKNASIRNGCISISVE